MCVSRYILPLPSLFFIPLKNVFFFLFFFCEFHKRATAGSVASFRRRAVFVSPIAPRSRSASFVPIASCDTSRANCSISRSRAGHFHPIIKRRRPRGEKYRNILENVYINMYIACVSRDRVENFRVLNDRKTLKIRIFFS